jgi:hypothetical protein
MSEQVQPATSLAQATSLLRRPFTVHAVQFRILEGRDGDKANCAAYIEASTAIDRLNLVVPGMWSNRFFDVGEPGRLGCAITVDGQTREDVGTTEQAGQAVGCKGLRSDAFKRAAVLYGVGISIRALPRLQLRAATKPFPKGVHVKAYPKMRNGAPVKDDYGNPKYSYYLMDAGEQELRRVYQDWLDTVGIKAFGQPLDHGHVAGSRDSEDPAPLPDVAPTPVPATTRELPGPALLVVQHAVEVGHAQLSDPATVAMMVSGMTAETLREWAEEKHAELDGTREQI